LGAGRILSAAGFWALTRAPAAASGQFLEDCNTFSRVSRLSRFSRFAVQDSQAEGRLWRRAEQLLNNATS